MKYFFEKEVAALRSVEELFESQSVDGVKSEPAMVALCKEYKKLLRQSKRLLSMGDRMQNSLNAANQELSVSESRYRSIFENVEEGIYSCSPDGVFFEVNPAMASIFGCETPDEFLKEFNEMRNVFHDEDIYLDYRKALFKGCIQRFEIQAETVNGEKIWGEISERVIEGYQDNSEKNVVGVFTDITARKMMHEQICYLARTDSLTKLWNRRYFSERASQEITRCIRQKRPLALLMVDADNFKQVNDTYGHDVGDITLVSIAQALTQSVRDIDLVGRIGGEEFAILLPDADMECSQVVGQRILEKIRETQLYAETKCFSVTASIGISTLTNAQTFDALLKCADVALYAAKTNGRNRIEYFNRAGYGPV